MIGLYVGRFQPPHLGHKHIIDVMSKECVTNFVFIIKGTKTSLDKNRNPFDLKKQTSIFKSFLPKNVFLIVSESAFVVPYIQSSRHDSFRMYCGEDRNEYHRFVDYVKPKHLEIKVLDYEREFLNGSHIRALIKQDRLKEAAKLIPKGGFEA